MIIDYSRDTYSGKKPEILVIFMHGLGSSGHLMEQYVGDLLGPLLPEAKLRFPDAPVQMGWDNHSWFELRDVIDRDVADIRQAVVERAPFTAKQLNAYIDRVMAEDGIPPNKVIIAGFSQGGTMAFYTALMRDTEVAGVYALSGGALDLIPEINSKPPVQLAAGVEEQQDYSGVSMQERAEKFLKAKGFSVATTILDGQKHSITPKSMELLRDFAREKTAETPANNHANPGQPLRKKPPAPGLT